MSGAGTEAGADGAHGESSCGGHMEAAGTWPAAAAYNSLRRPIYLSIYQTIY